MRRHSRKREPEDASGEGLHELGVYAGADQGLQDEHDEQQHQKMIAGSGGQRPSPEPLRSVIVRIRGRASREQLLIEVVSPEVDSEEDAIEGRDEYEGDQSAEEQADHYPDRHPLPQFATANVQRDQTAPIGNRRG